MIPASLAAVVASLAASFAGTHDSSHSRSFDCLVPPSPAPFEVTQPDGEVLRLRLRGSALHHWHETTEGYPVLVHDGAWVYAQLVDGALMPTPLVVGASDPAQAGVQVHVRPTDLDGVAPHADRAAPPVAGPTAAPRVAKATGEVKNLVLLLRFADHGPLGQDRDLPSDADVDILMNAVGGDPALAPTGSVRDHYLETSYGQLSVNSTVVGWIDVPETETYYAAGSSGLTFVTWELIEAGLAAADASVDFSQFDADGDGWIDAITFLHSGYGAEWGGTDDYGTWYADRMWSHKWSIPTWTSEEGVRVSDYNISAGLWGLSGDEPGHIGVITHEIGHFFGLPDLYDTDGTSEGLGNWDLMAGGSWGFAGDQLHPSHPSVWCKQTLGWLQPELALPGVHVLDGIEWSPSALRIDSGYPPGEYLLIENRQPFGFDQNVARGGIAVYHIDETKGFLGSNNVNNDEGHPDQFGWPENGSHYRIAMLQADGRFELEQGWDRGDKGDVYHGAVVDSIDGSSSPNLDAYQEGEVLLNGNAVLGISGSARRMVLTYSNPGAPAIGTSALPPAVVGQPYSASLDATGGQGELRWSEYRADTTYEQTVLGESLFRESGVAMGWQADEAVWPLELPFSFPYGETAYDTLYVSSNGFIDVAPSESEWFGTSAYLAAATRIAPLWGDLTTESGDIYVEASTPRGITVRWEGHAYSTGLPVNASATLFATGRIEFHYGDGNLFLEPVIGLSRSFGTHVDLVPTHNGAGDLSGAPSVRFELQGSQLPRGLRLSPDGTLAGTPLESGTFEPTFRATDANWVYGMRSLELEVGARAAR